MFLSRRTKFLNIKQYRQISSFSPIIDGKHLQGETYSVISHDSEKILYDVHSIGTNLQEIPRICDIANRGFFKWRETDTKEKSQILSRTIDIIETRRSEIIDSLRDIGVPNWFAIANINESINMLQECISKLSQPLGLVPQSSHDLSLVLREPIGPVLSVSPWNAPAILSMRAIAAPLAAGCSVIVKSSEKAANIFNILIECFLEAGLPPDVISLVHCKSTEAPAVVEHFIANKHVRKVNFTGSTAVGKKIAQLCGENLKPVLLELGGKNAAIVTEEADLDSAAQKIVWGGWAHMGQICMSTERVFVIDSIYDKFIAKCIEHGSRLIGDATQELELHQRDRSYSDKIARLIDNAIDKGATVIFGEVSKTPGKINPLMLSDVTPEMEIYSTETFGPVFFITKVKSTKEAITLVNESEYGLMSSIWCKSHLKALKIARQIESGGVHINGATVNDEAQLPHGGVKSSGYGRFNSVWGIDEFTYVKTITFSE